MYGQLDSHSHAVRLSLSRAVLKFKDELQSHSHTFTRNVYTSREDERHLWGNIRGFKT